jgi:uncharacterized protein (TIGR02246 family)
MRAFTFIALFVFVSKFAIAQTERDREAVKQVIIAFQDDFNDGPFLNAQHYSTDYWVHINPVGGITRSREEVLHEVREVHKSFLKGVTMIIEKIDIRFVAPTVAVAEVLHKLSPFEFPQGIMNEDQRNIKIYVVVKNKGRWLMTHDQNTIVQGASTGEIQN